MGQRSAGGGSVSDPKSNTGGLGGYHPSTNNAQSGIQYGCECRQGLGHWLRPRNQPFDLGGRRISIKPNLAGDRRCRRKLPTTTRLIKTSRLGNASKAQNRGGSTLLIATSILRFFRVYLSPLPGSQLIPCVFTCSVD